MTVSRRHFALSAGAFALAAGPAFARASGKAKASPAPKEVQARSPLLSYEGRTADMGDGTVRAGFPGVVLRTRFDGTKLTLKTAASSDNLYLDISVDGGAPKMVHLAKGAQQLVAFEGTAGTHTVEIARRNESWEGVWDIAGATVEGGGFVTPPDLPAKKLMFIGDSITCGAACDVARDDPREDMTVNNAQKTYAKLLAKRLNTQVHLVSYGGRGLIRDWQGIRDTNNAPQFYERAAPDEAGPLWNPANYVPDAIGIMLGQNDFNQGIPDQNEFVNAYVEFVEKVRRDAPKAVVFLIDTPIATDDAIPRRTVLQAYIDEVVRRLRSPLVSHANIKHYAGRPANGHPIAEDHIGIADELEPLFKKALG
ncbi:GDSL-type esterase/lipase family protein [Asticcacaulis solisilvae]|uniref:GDSL-type esterase/lipase family protein n=1 Tax=Asticcacaulis solisilvae TaxID=1217274 RepID=UPI003FD6C773